MTDDAALAAGLKTHQGLVTNAAAHGLILTPPRTLRRPRVQPPPLAVLPS